MLKKHSKIKFFIITIIAMLGVLLCVCPFSIPYSMDTFNGFVPAINKGIELGGGVEAVYSCQLKNGETATLEASTKAAADKIYGLYSQLSYSELYVNILGEDKIQLVMSHEARVADEIYDYLQDAKEFSMTLTEASDSVSPEKFVVAKDVKSVRADYDYEASSYGIRVNFTEEGIKNIERMKKTAEKEEKETVYIYVGQPSSANLIASLEVGEISDGMLITSSSYSNDVTTLEACHNIIAGSLNVSLEKEGVHAISPTLGVNANIYIAIALGVIIVASIVLVCFRYGHLGLLGSLAMVFYLVLFAFLLQAIPFVTLNLTGVVACVVAYLIALVSSCYIFEKIREEYAVGKKIHISCKSAFKKALWPIIDSHVAGILAAICIWIFAPAGVTIFGVVMFVGLMLSLVINLGVLRWFVYLYLPINSSKAKPLHLYREKGVKEIKDEVEIIPEDQVNSQIMEGENE
ncbi:MAG: hypothetical protein J6A28_00480 [Clostridia bacterium]|nr:hypothetical protein [Clostridia bacterium]